MFYLCIISVLNRVVLLLIIIRDVLFTRAAKFFEARTTLEELCLFMTVMSRTMRSPSNLDDDMVIISLDSNKQKYQPLDDDEFLLNQTNFSLYQRIKLKLIRFWNRKPRLSTFMLTFSIMSIILLIVVLSIHPTKSKNKHHDKTISSSPETTYDYSPYYTSSTKAAVASDVGVCSDMGLSILKLGGNAVDASVTVALCLGVMSPG